MDTWVQLYDIQASVAPFVIYDNIQMFPNDDN